MAGEFDIDQVVPWGRSKDEYVRMFALKPEELERPILDCGGGPASFNAEMTALGYAVTSCDPIYAFEAAQIEQRVQDTYPKILEGVERAKDRFVWGEIRDPEHLGHVRLQAMHAFLADYPAGRKAGRYVATSLPPLPFADHAFKLALVSHLLFLYSDQMDADFHLAAIQELLRVAPELRIFPLLDMHGAPSAHLEAVSAELQNLGYLTEQVRVNYEFQRGGNTMLVVKRRE